MKHSILILCASLGLLFAPALTHADSLPIEMLAVLGSDAFAFQNVGLSASVHANLALGVSRLPSQSSTDDSLDEDGVSPRRHKSDSLSSADESSDGFLDLAVRSASDEPGEVSRHGHRNDSSFGFGGDVLAFNLGPDNLLANAFGSTDHTGGNIGSSGSSGSGIDSGAVLSDMPLTTPTPEPAPSTLLLSAGLVAGCLALLQAGRHNRHRHP